MSIQVESYSVGKCSPRDGNIEIFVELGRLGTRIYCKMSAIWDFPSDDNSSTSINVEYPAVSILNKQFRDNLFFSSKDDSVLALNSDNSPKLCNLYSAA